MPFPLDAAVVVKSIGKTGRIVEAGRNGRYRVRVGGVVMACREEDLGEPAAGDRKRRRGKAGQSTSEAVLHSSSSTGRAGQNVPSDFPSQSERRRLESLDLHGFTVEEAVRKVEERIDLALRAGVNGIEIIHGRSSGRIKVAVHRLLRELNAVRHFEVVPDNPGVTRVFF